MLKAMMNLWAILFVCLFGVPLSLGWTPPWGPSPWREAGGLVPRVWGPDCPSPYRQARMSSDPHGCLVLICCRVEQDLSQFQLLTSNWLTTLTSANLLGLHTSSADSSCVCHVPSGFDPRSPHPPEVAPCAKMAIHYMALVSRLRHSECFKLFPTHKPIVWS